MKLTANDWRKLVIISSISFILLWKVYILNPSLQSIKEINSKIQQATVEFEQLKTKHRELLEKKMEYIINKEKNKDLEFYLIKDRQELLNIINNIYSVARKNNITITGSSSGKKINYSDYNIDNFLNVTLLANYKDLLEFLAAVNDIKYIVQLNSININKSGDSNSLDVKISFICYTQQ